MPRKHALPAEVRKVIRSALAPSVSALRRLARYRLEPSLERRLQALGERKEFLGKEEHDELVALVAFAQRRSIEKLEAKVALKRLNELLPDVAVRACVHGPGTGPSSQPRGFRSAGEGRA